MINRGYAEGRDLSSAYSVHRYEQTRIGDRVKVPIILRLQATKPAATFPMIQSRDVYRGALKL